MTCEVVRILIFLSHFDLNPLIVFALSFVDFSNGGNGGEESGDDKQAATKGRVFDSTANRATTASGPRESNIDKYWWKIYKSGDLEVLES
ncbi:hypothetical protein Tco_1064475 [Tanacetum coccineum]